MAFANVDSYKTAKLIDGVIYPDAIKDIIKNKLGLEEDDDINQVSMSEMLDVPEDNKEEGGKIAIYYAYGEIVDQPLSGYATEHAIVGSEVVEDLKKLADDEDIKAVVMRVNSPGGSAVASEQIWHAIKLLKEKKPFVVSMGGYAASGGYMISAPANYIIAEPTTVTGSIGIFGLIPNASELVTDKLGVTWDGVQTNKHTDYETNLIFGKDNEEELRYLQAYVDRGYDTFLSIVAEGRGMTKDQVHEIAQGRVWLATDALPIKLVDKIGSLNDAVKKAAELADCSEYYTASYPAKTSWFDQLLASTDDSKGTYLDQQLKETLGELYEPIIELRKDCQRNRLQARFPFASTIK
jgi:protease-4